MIYASMKHDAAMVWEQIMTLKWVDSLDSIDWQELSDLYRIAPLGEKSPDYLKRVFSNSFYRCFAIEAGQIVGAGRALADGGDCSYICDVAILPTHQGRGIGAEIIKKLVKLSQDHKKIILYSVPGQEAFYEKLGFRPMTTAMAIFENQQRAIDNGLVRDN